MSDDGRDAGANGAYLKDPLGNGYGVTQLHGCISEHSLTVMGSPLNPLRFHKDGAPL